MGDDAINEKEGEKGVVSITVKKWYYPKHKNHGVNGRIMEMGTETENR